MRWVLGPAPGKGEAMKWKSSILSSPLRPAVSKAPAVTYMCTLKVFNIPMTSSTVGRHAAPS